MIGDPGGIGPEVVLKALATGEPSTLCTPILIGKKHVLDRTLAACGIDLPLTVVGSAEEADDAEGIAVLEVGSLEDGAERLTGDVARRPLDNAIGTTVPSWHRVSSDVAGDDVGAYGHLRAGDV